MKQKNVAFIKKFLNRGIFFLMIVSFAFEGKWYFQFCHEVRNPSFFCVWFFFFILLFKSKEQELVAEKAAYRIEWLFRVVILMGRDEVIEHSNNSKLQSLTPASTIPQAWSLLDFFFYIWEEGGLWLAYLFQEEYQEFSNFIFKSGIWLILEACREL